MSADPRLAPVRIGAAPVHAGSPRPAPAARSEPLLVAAVGLGFLMVVVDATAVNVVLPAIGAALGGSLGGLQWVASAYTLAFACLLLTGGVLGDRLGARRVFLAGLGLFTGASACCGLAPTLAALVTARVAQGAGAALLLPASLTLLAHAFPDPARRMRAVGAWSGMGGVALIAGPTLGGLAAAAAGWRAVFWLNLPVGAAALVLAGALLAETAPRRRGFDLQGQALAVVSLGTLTAALIEAGRLGWSHPAILGGLALAAAAAGLFVAVERRAPEPMVPPGLFRSAGFTAPVLVGLLYNFAFYGVQFVAALHLQGARGASPAEVGLLFLPLTLTSTAFAFAAGPIAARLGPRRPMAGGMTAAALGTLVMAVVGPTPAALAAGGVLVGAGGGLLSGPVTACVLASAPRDRSGVASGVLNAARQTGGALGVAILGTVLGDAGAPDGRTRVALVAVALAFAAAATLSAIFVRHRPVTAATSVPERFRPVRARYVEADGALGVGRASTS